MSTLQCHRRQLRDELLTTETALPIKIDLYRVSGDGKVDKRTGSLTGQDFASYRIRTCSVTLKRGVYALVPVVKKKSVTLQFYLRVAVTPATDVELKLV